MQQTGFIEWLGIVGNGGKEKKIWWHISSLDKWMYDDGSKWNRKTTIEK